ncbi:hypothetical protein WA026_012808 [Henosepilachna vigintioctopunctata]|uniref:Pre-rRNA-processing protein TSR2 homolog n=1 Tax=Henosepilachna vigintioctopunctata TaxID=420089 RepID=A0AAW1TMG9_9CUCU
MEEIFSKVVNQVFNNWTGLKLAVEHSLGGSNSLQVANDIKDYMVKYCLYESNVQVEDIQDALDDIMDEEFNTICEDNSTKDISIILFRFLQLIRENNLAQLEIEMNSLPTASSEWLTVSTCSKLNSSCQDTVAAQRHESEISEETPMEQDSEWTTVKSKKKR